MKWLFWVPIVFVAACGYQPMGSIEGFEFDLVHLLFESGVR